MSSGQRKKPGRARRNREGDPWLRRDGRWEARVWPPEGSIDTKPRHVYGKTRDECVANREKKKAALAAGVTDPTDKDITIGEYMETWLGETLNQYLTAGDLTERTVESYRQNARLHIVPYLGHVKLRKLTAPMVRQWRDKLLRKPSAHVKRGASTPEPLSVRTVTYCRAILRKAIDDAVRDETAGLVRNVVDLVTPPKDRDHQEIEAITPQEASALLLAMAEDKLWCYWLLCFALGTRRGEALGMRWEDLDRPHRIWRPAYQVQRVKSEPDPVTGRTVTTLALVPLKTRASRQPVALPVSVVQALDTWEEQQNGARATSAAWVNLGLVFTTSVGTALEPRTVNRLWEAVCLRAGTRVIRIHDLRHAFCTYLLNAGVDLKSVQGAARHSRMTTTMLYVHALEEVPMAAADAMDRILASLAAQPVSVPLQSALPSDGMEDARGKRGATRP